MITPTTRETLPIAEQREGIRGNLPSIVLLIVNPRDLSLYPARPFTPFTAHTTADAILQIERTKPHVIVIDWDFPDVDGRIVCRLASASSSLLVTISRPEHAPEALKAGCDALLLKPFAPNLAAARIGRLLHGDAQVQRMARGPATQPEGTNRVWADAVCEQCGTPGAISFEFFSYRRS